MPNTYIIMDDQASILELKAKIRQLVEALQANQIFHTPLALSRKPGRKWDEYEIDAINRTRAALSKE